MPLRFAYYADDFTGATDALESLARAGLRTRLFLDPPSAEKCSELDAIGVAGLTRALAPDAMEAALRPAFAVLRALGPRHVHYKVCSTFDSSPAMGSIGRAIDIGAEIFGGPVVPLLVAAPALGRYCAFGNLFARYGIGGAGAIHRLDRHPSVSKHPVTPMTEADLRVHLAKQTAKSIGLIDVTDLERSPEESAAALHKLVSAGHEVVLFDGLNSAHLLRVGALIDELAGASPLFSIGSSGVGAALTSHWGLIPHSGNAASASATPVLVVSGSCSPVTGAQIDWALANGFAGAAFDPAGDDSATALAAATSALRAGQSAIIYSSRGQVGTPVSAEKLGARLGRLAHELIARTSVQRLVIVGGDTSSYAGRALGIESLEMIAPLSPGAPLCRAQAPGSPADGIEIVFKGGQVGAPDFFGSAVRGAR
jgi:3-oxoisoapionate kinase